MAGLACEVNLPPLKECGQGVSLYDLHRSLRCHGSSCEDGECSADRNSRILGSSYSYPGYVHISVIGGIVEWRSCCFGTLL